MKPIFIISLLMLITYAMAEGIQYGSILGILLATCSLIALGIAIYLFEQLKKAETQDADYQ